MEQREGPWSRLRVPFALVVCVVLVAMGGMDHQDRVVHHDYDAAAVHVWVIFGAVLIATGLIARGGRPAITTVLVGGTACALLLVRLYVLAPKETFVTGSLAGVVIVSLAVAAFTMFRAARAALPPDPLPYRDPATVAADDRLGFVPRRSRAEPESASERPRRAYRPKI